MDALEELVTRRLDALGGDHTVPPGVLDRALRAVERRRHRRQALGALASGVAVVALVVGITTLDGTRGGTPPVDLPAPAPERVELDDGLADLLGTTTAAVVVPREHGWFDFRATSLTADGTLAGADQHYDPQWFDTFGSARDVDLTTGEQGTYVVADEVTRVMLAGADASSRLTLEHLDPRHKFDLVCTPRVGGERAQMSDGSVAESSVLLDAGHLVWSTYPDGDEPYRVWTADGCGGTPTLFETPGLVRAVSWPDLYLSTPDDPWLVRLDAETGEAVDLPRPDVETGDLPGAIGELEHVDVAASADVLAWTVGDRLLVQDLGSGDAVVAAADLPLVTGNNGTQVQVSVGDRFVAWFTSPVDGDPGRSEGLLHDTATGATAAISGEVWTNGPWVVWLADDGYRVVRTG